MILIETVLDEITCLVARVTPVSSTSIKGASEAISERIKIFEWAEIVIFNNFLEFCLFWGFFCKTVLAKVFYTRTLWAIAFFLSHFTSVERHNFSLLITIK